MPKTPLSTYLTIRRRESGRSLTQAAAVAGVGRSTLHRYETGASVPPAERCGQIADAYEVPVSALQPLIDAAQARP